MNDGQLELIPPAPRLSTCRSCKRSIIWTRTERDKKMPLDADPVDELAHPEGEHSNYTGLFVLRETENRDGPLALAAWGLEGTEPHYISHFATCPHADEHRRRPSAQKSELAGDSFEDIFKDEPPQDRMQIR